jgi:phosphoribosylformylglycinamidine synthase subunit PurS
MHLPSLACAAKDGREIPAPQTAPEAAMKARVTVMLKNGVLDVQGEAVRHALGTLGFAGVNGVRQGKVIELDLAETDATKAEASVKAMCDKLLANAVIESYRVELG